MSKTTRRVFVQNGLTAAVATRLPVRSAESTTRPKNVLFIGVDDLCTQIGCYGADVKTPNLDALATRGIRFNAAYCQFPWCSPSRSSLMTGLSPDRTKVWDLQTHFREALPDVVTLGQLFRQNGYYSARVGKIYHASDPGEEGTDGLDDPETWDWTFNPAGIDHFQEEAQVTNYTPKRGLGSSIAFHRSKAPDHEITDAIGASEVVRLLEERRSQPFFIAYGLYRPHVPWIVPQRFFEMYPLDSLTPVPVTPEELKIAPPAAYWTHPPNFGMDIEQQKHALQGYHAATTFMDEQIGRVLTALKASPHADNTLVIFWSDHGWQLGQHAQWMKQTLFEDAARVPLIMAGAGVPARGKVCLSTVEHLDVYPTIANLCGLNSIPGNLHGESMVPLLHDIRAPWSKPAISQVRRPGNKEQPMINGYSIRDNRFRYTSWNEAREGEELYDYQTDPRGVHNAIHDPAMAPIIHRLRVALHTTTLARGRVPLLPADPKPRS